jgi:hypothetical protein
MLEDWMNTHLGLGADWFLLDILHAKVGMNKV